MTPRARLSWFTVDDAVELSPSLLTSRVSSTLYTHHVPYVIGFITQSRAPCLRDSLDGVLDAHGVTRSLTHSELISSPPSLTSHSPTGASWDLLPRKLFPPKCLSQVLCLGEARTKYLRNKEPGGAQSWGWETQRLSRTTECPGPSILPSSLLSR